ncbi:unnamed protein product [Durusdinium trenchii]|uniref:Uncharacterized protein n=2 Tax=Durusdinium trenchii TaxID=1381693 RepID=A0ABP0RN11_9DINO
MANATDVIFRFILQVSLSVERFSRWLEEVAVPALRQSSENGWSYQVGPSAVLRGSDSAGQVVDVQWSFKHGPQESLDWILCSMNVSSKATGDPPVVAAFCLGAYDSNFLLRFGMARRDDDRPAALDGRHFFELESLRIPLQLTPLASKHRGEFTYCTMRGAGRSTCRGCYFDQLDDPDAATSESCAKCAFVAGLEDVYSHLQDHDFLAEMERWLLGWRYPRGMRRRWLSLTLERSESALSCVAERVVSFVFPEGHPLDTIQAEDLRYPR